MSQRYYRKVFRISGDDSPNVRLAKLEISKGLRPSGRTLLPGVLGWADYCKRRQHWDKIKQCIGLDGCFYEGAENLLFPPEWLNHAEELARRLRGRQRRPRWGGGDPAEGGDFTALAAIDEFGLVELVAKKTPDTNVVAGEIAAFLRKHGIAPEDFCIDRGGGGKEHADRLRAQGLNVRTVGFGEAVAQEPRRGMTIFSERVELREERYAYKNRRAQMYHELSLLLDPAAEGGGFAISAECEELRRQMAPVPKWYDEEGRIYLPPKSRRADQKDKPGQKVTLGELLGRSPDELDALVLAAHARLHRGSRAQAGAL